ncbi:MAG: hypothetical protein A3E82_01145 [Gammaproteobacteria bacterium RIFCSPHIGHO2_12_FULL_38_11]|nr:MAG: hypothetical protein A3E82_01145 [Gammaproteobacteria bacterium RIFCSPHIGHO2_12_FULL_38_11]
MYVLINDHIISEEKAYIHIKDRGFLLSDGVFETLKVQNGHIEFFNAHYERLKYSATTLFIPFHYNADALKAMCLELIKENELNHSIASMRITLTRGIGLRGINFPEKPTPTLLITAAPYHQPVSDQYSRAFITSIIRNQYSPITKLKTLNYFEPILARNEAHSNGFDEGIMLNTNGFITECSTANIFFVKDNIVITPSAENGILPGIIRNHIIVLCHKNNIKLIEKSVSVNDAMNADEVFQTNSLIGIQPISQINEKKFSVDNFIFFKKISDFYKNNII